MTSEKLRQMFQGRFQDAAFLVLYLENFLLSKRFISENSSVWSELHQRLLPVPELCAHKPSSVLWATLLEKVLGKGADGCPVLL